MKIDRHSPQPLYAQLKELLILRIQTGVYKPGDQIPSEMTLCQELSLSRPTVRQAVAELVNEGVLVIEKGRGTFVATEPERIDLKNINAGSFSLLSARNLGSFLNLTVDALDSEPEIDRLFSISDNTNRAGYWSVSWLQKEEGKVYAFCRSLIPVYMFPDLGPDLVAGKRMLDILANKYPYLPQRMFARLFVRQTRSEEMRLLDLPRHTPVIVISSRLISRSGNVCEISTAVLRSDLVSLGLDSGRS